MVSLSSSLPKALPSAGSVAAVAAASTPSSLTISHFPPIAGLRLAFSPRRCLHSSSPPLPKIQSIQAAHMEATPQAAHMKATPQHGEPVVEKYALILVVADETNLLDFAAGLHELGYTIISDAKTVSSLKVRGISAIRARDFNADARLSETRRLIESFLGREYPEFVHPAIHGAIRGWTDNRRTDNRRIDIVVANIDLDDNEIDYEITFGVVNSISAAVENYKHTLTVVDPNDYAVVLKFLGGKGDDVTFRHKLACKALDHLYHGETWDWKKGLEEIRDDEIPVEFSG